MEIHAHKHVEAIALEDALDVVYVVVLVQENVKITVNLAQDIVHKTVHPHAAEDVQDVLIAPLHAIVHVAHTVLVVQADAMQIVQQLVHQLV